MRHPGGPGIPVLLLLSLAIGAFPLVLPVARASSPTDSSEIPECGLRDSGSSARDEWAGCISVDADLSRAPQVGERARLSYSVSSDLRSDRARVIVELPDTLRFVSPDEDVVRTHQDGERTTSTIESITLSPEAPAVQDLLVEAIAPGTGQVRVRVTSSEGPGTQAGQADVFLTVGRSDANSELDIESPDTLGVESQTGESVGLPASPEAPDTSTPEDPVTDVAASQGTAAPTPGPSEACVTGTWQYDVQANVTKPSRNFGVEVWDDDSATDDLLDSSVTSSTGAFESCFPVTDDEGGQVDPYVRFVAENDLWKVQNTSASGTSWKFSTGAVSDLAAGATHDFGALEPADATYMRALSAFDAANSAWNWTPKSPQGCWDADDSSCRKVIINWTPTSTNGTYYSLGTNQIFLKADDPNSHFMTVHEIGHGVMDDIYEDAYPPFPNCSPHTIWGDSSQGCAWTEGFAEWYPAMVFDDPHFRWPNGASVNLENSGWQSSADDGDVVEGRIAAALIDLSDATNEAPWDRSAEGEPGNVWETFAEHHPDTLAQFWSQRQSDGFDVSNATGVATLFGNTIDYNFRDPMTDSVTYERPVPVADHNFQLDTQEKHWSVIGLRNLAGSDKNLTLYGNSGLTQILGTASSNTPTDFIAIDSNRYPLGDFYPSVSLCSPCFNFGDYSIQFVEGSSVLSEGITANGIGGDDVVDVFDLPLTASVPVTIEVSPTGGFDLAAHVLSPGGDAIQSPTEAFRDANDGGAGAPELLSFTPESSGRHALVITDLSGGDDYSIDFNEEGPVTTQMSLDLFERQTTLKVEGTLLPAPGDENVTVRLQKRKGDGSWRGVLRARRVEVEEEGSFLTVFGRPEEKGRYRVRTEFAGNEKFFPTRTTLRFRL